MLCVCCAASPNTINGMSLSDYIRYGDAGPPKKEQGKAVPRERTQARDRARREEEEKKARKVRGGPGQPFA